MTFFSAGFAREILGNSELLFRNVTQDVQIFYKFYRLLDKIWTVCLSLATYAFQIESTHYSCLNVKELFARSRCKI